MPASLLDFLAGGLVQSGFWGLFAYFLVVTQLTIFTVTLYLHRSQTHRRVGTRGGTGDLVAFGGRCQLLVVVHGVRLY